MKVLWPPDTPSASYFWPISSWCQVITGGPQVGVAYALPPDPGPSRVCDVHPLDRFARRRAPASQPARRAINARTGDRTPANSPVACTTRMPVGRPKLAASGAGAREEKVSCRCGRETSFGLRASGSALPLAVGLADEGAAAGAQEFRIHYSLRTAGPKRALRARAGVESGA